MVSHGDVAHHAGDSPVRPPQAATSLVVVHWGRDVTLVPGELSFLPVCEEGILGVEVVGIPMGIHPLLRRELEVEVVRDGRLAGRTWRHRRNRNPSIAQHPAGGQPVPGRAWVAGGV